MNVQPITAIEEVNMFKSDGNVIHFSAPKGESQPRIRTKKRRDHNPESDCRASEDPGLDEVT